MTALTVYLHTVEERLLFRLNQAVTERDVAQEAVRILSRRIAQLEARLKAVAS